MVIERKDQWVFAVTVTSEELELVAQGLEEHACNHMSVMAPYMAQLSRDGVKLPVGGKVGP